MVGQRAQTELERKLAQARQIVLEIMEADESGQVTIGYGNGGLRIEYSRHSKPVPVLERQPVIDNRDERVIAGLRHKR